MAMMVIEAKGGVDCKENEGEEIGREGEDWGCYDSSISDMP